jgi:hypothetical protein
MTCCVLVLVVGECILVRTLVFAVGVARGLGCGRDVVTVFEIDLVRVLGRVRV